MSTHQPVSDPFSARDTFETGAGKAGIYRLSKLQDAGLGNITALPYSIRVLLESLLRNCDGYVVTEDDVKALAAWNAAAPAQVEIPFKPARVVLQDFTGVPCVVDLAAMRAAMQRLGGDPEEDQSAGPRRPGDRPLGASRLLQLGRRAGTEHRHGVRAQPRALRVPALGPEGVRQLPRRAARHRASSTR